MFCVGNFKEGLWQKFLGLTVEVMLCFEVVVSPLKAKAEDICYQDRSVVPPRNLMGNSAVLATYGKASPPACPRVGAAS